MDLYAPVICIDRLTALPSVAQTKSWSIGQVHFKGAFLYAILSELEEIWVKMRYITGTKFVGQIGKLVKSLYGLEQAPKLRYQYLYAQLKNWDLKDRQ